MESAGGPWSEPSESQRAVMGDSPPTTAPGPVADAVAPEVPSVTEEGRLVDRGEIARGGMGTVHRMYDRVLRREIAMKVSDPNGLHYAQTAMRFMEEAQITGQLDHPNIVPVHDLCSGSESTGVFITMKLVHGETLTALCERIYKEPFSQRSIERVLNVILKVCDALSFAHARRVIHRDVKPDNIMVGSHGQVYLMDWGVAMLRGEMDAPRSEAPPVSLSEDLRSGVSEEQGAIVGTFDYMAPEQAWGKTKEIDERTDVFGLGSVLYHVLTGAGPNRANTAFEALQNAQRGRAAPPQTRGRWPTLPPGLCAITMRALSREPADRYQSVAELRDELEDFLRGGGWFATEQFEPGTLVVREGAPAETAYIIVDGTCEVFKEVDGQRVVLRRMGPGDVFGETAILTGEPRSATVMAIDRLTVKVVTREALEHELRRQSWGGAFVKALAERFRDVDAQLSRLRSERSESD